MQATTIYKPSEPGYLEQGHSYSQARVMAMLLGEVGKSGCNKGSPVLVGGWRSRYK